MADSWMHSLGLQIAGNISFNSTANVAGAGSNFLSTFLPGDLIAYYVSGSSGPKYYLRVLSVTNDTALILTAAAPNTRPNILAYLIPRTAQVTGADGHLYNLAPPAVGETPVNTDSGKLFVPSTAVAAAAALTGGNNTNWSITDAPAAPPAPPVIPDAATLMAPPIGEELDTFVVIGQTDGHQYSVTAYETTPLVYRQTVPPQAVNPLIADGWAVV